MARNLYLPARRRPSGLVQLVLWKVFRVFVASCKVFPFNALTLLVGWQEVHLTCKKLDIGLLVVIIWLETEHKHKTSCVGGRHNMPPPPASWPLTLKVVSESRVTWATSVPILVYLGLSVLDLGSMYATDRRQMRIASAPYPRGRDMHNNATQKVPYRTAQNKTR